MWPPSLWFYPVLPWLMATRLPVMFFDAMMAAYQPPVRRRAAPFTAEIIPFPVRRAAAG